MSKICQNAQMWLTTSVTRYGQVALGPASKAIYMGVTHGPNPGGDIFLLEIYYFLNAF